MEAPRLRTGAARERQVGSIGRAGGLRVERSHDGGRELEKVRLIGDPDVKRRQIGREARAASRERQLNQKRDRLVELRVVGGMSERGLRRMGRGRRDLLEISAHPQLCDDIAPFAALGKDGLHQMTHV